MAIQQRYKEKGTRRSSASCKDKGSESKNPTDRNFVRREKYHSDEVYRENAVNRSISTYRKKHPRSKSSRLANGLLVPGVRREVTSEGVDHPETVVCYRLSEAAKALGRSTLTLKRWIQDKLVPEPIIRDTTYNYKQYSEGELQLIAKHLAEHEKVYDYLHYTHSTTIHKMWQSIEAYRKSYL